MRKSSKKYQKGGKPISESTKHTIPITDIDMDFIAQGSNLKINPRGGGTADNTLTYNKLNDFIISQQVALQKKQEQDALRQYAIEDSEELQKQKRVGIPKKVSAYQAYVNNTTRRKDNEAQGLTADGKPTFLGNVAQNKHFEKFADNIAIPMMEMSALNDMGGLAKSAISEAWLGKALGIDTRSLLTKNVAHQQKAFEDIKKGNEWLRDWYGNPTTKERYEDFIEKGVANKTSQNATLELAMVNSDFKNKLGINLSKRLAPRLYGTVARNNLNDLINGEDIVSGSTTPVGGPSTVARYRHSDNSALVDINHPAFTTKYDVGNTTVHEGIHKLTKGDGALTHNAKVSLKSAFEVPLDNKGFPISKYDTYLTEPTEIHARVGELRRQYGFTPDTYVTNPMVENIMKEGLEGKTS